MSRNLLITLALCVVVFLLSQFGRIVGFRIALDSLLTHPVRTWIRQALSSEVSQQKTESMIRANYDEVVRQLERENKTLRQQLGAIPEVGKLFPARTTWLTSSELIVRFPYPEVKVARGTPVVWDKLFIGTVDRREGETVVIHRATDSSFSIDGKTEKGVQGKILGSFNEEVRFETATDAPLTKKDRVYAVDKISGGMYLVGTIEKILVNQRLPLKSATVNYMAGEAQLDTVFILLQ